MDIREEIRKASSVIPNSVMTGSVQQSIRWKERAMYALRVADNPKSTDHELKMALASLTRNA